MGGMRIALKAVSGPLKDKVFPLKEGLTIGRQGAGIALDDAKISSIHARIVKTGEDWFVTDNNSKNGIRVNGEKVDSVELKVGNSFWAGDTHFLVVGVAHKEKPKPTKKQRYWHSVLVEFIEEHAAAFKDRVRPVSPLEPALVLEFVRGTKSIRNRILGFGPRKVGSASVDLPIWEPGAPATCFEVLPTPEGLLFKTAHKHIVTLNGEAIDSQVLRMGDTIRILDTLIEVDFAE
ncbi:MAG: FHA domain-containing protein [Bdellovibrionaceae bacterium]|nr:FHA domain-containing protein [Pseudobdellovibrionaceae bacterium]